MRVFHRQSSSTPDNSNKVPLLIKVYTVLINLRPEDSLEICNPDNGRELGNDETPSLALSQSIDYPPLLTRASVKVHSHIMDQTIIMAPHK